MLEWNVYKEDFNGKEITTYNIFHHYGFYNDLLKAKKKPEDEFKEAVKTSLMYHFWSKCEWEIILSDWPPSPEERGFKKEKVDVYDQVMLNWDIFIEYVWNHKNEIKKGSFD